MTRSAIAVLIPILTLAACAGDVLEPTLSFTSVLFEESSCKKLDQASSSGSEDDASGSDAPRLCAGPGGYSVVETYSAAGTLRTVEHKDTRFRVDILPREHPCVNPYYDHFEWRQANGIPFAVIARVECYGGAPDEEGNYTVPSNLSGTYVLIRGLEENLLEVDLDEGSDTTVITDARSTADSAFIASRRGAQAASSAGKR